MLMTGKEVGSIIGKGGEIINSIREESGAKIHISDGSIPERIVTVTGASEMIFKSFSLICKKLEDDGSGSHKSDSGSSSGKGGAVTLRLIVPASQCGSLIGKGGSKIKEIREVTGASVVVASEMLPNSTERTVTISGIRSAISQCIYHICCVMLESPPKGTTIPYTPKSNGLGLGMGGGNSRGGRGGHQVDNPLASLLGLGGGASTLAAIATLAGSQLRDRRGGSGGGGDRDDARSGGSNTQTYEMAIPNDMIGCIIGKGGSKIAEIRQLSGAMIRISKSDENGSTRSADRPPAPPVEGEASERQISISGNADSVALAKSLINMSLDLHKSRMEDRDSDRSGGSGGSYSMGGGNSGLGLAQLLSKPEALTSALTTLASLSSLGGLGGLSGLGGGNSNVHVTGIHRQRGGYGGNGGGGPRARDEDRSRDSKRSKFAPY
jgi:poly(rC)-binding protein 2/3/4